MKKIIVVLLFCVFFITTGYGQRYAIVVKEATLEDSAWAAVVDTLVARHNGKVFTYHGSIWTVLSGLTEYSPTYVCFVAKPQDIISDDGEKYIRRVHQLTRMLDDDPYGDAIWGVITGYTADDALRIASGPNEILIKTELTGTSAAWLSYVYQGIATFEAEYNRIRFKYPDGTIVDTTDSTLCPTDRTEFLVNHLNSDSFDIFITSGHANYNEWQLHYPNPGLEGYFRSHAGQLYGDPHDGPNIDVNSTNPKIYYAPGNCLIGLVKNMDCMVLAWLHTGGAYQYCGYTVVTWYGYMGWGISEYFYHLAGRFSFAEAFYLNNQALIFDLENNTPGTDPSGLEYDKDVVAFYGDPACRAHLYWDSIACKKPLYDQELIVATGNEKDTITFRITMNEEGRPWHQGGRPAFAFLPFRIEEPEILYMDAHNAVITDNFVLLDIWEEGDSLLKEGEQRQVVFTAKKVGIEEQALPKSSYTFELSQNYPNPFNRQTTIEYQLPTHTRVSLKIYNAVGRLVRTLVNEEQDAGHYSIVWNRRDNSGQKVGSGIYFYSIKTKGFNKTKKMILMK